MTWPLKSCTNKHDHWDFKVVQKKDSRGNAPTLVVPKWMSVFTNIPSSAGIHDAKWYVLQYAFLFVPFYPGGL